jgi:adenylosuccinate synthase
MNTGKVDVLLGLQWGDEGKGKVVDVLTPNYDVVARFQGGPNAGHTLEFQGQKYVLRSIPSGVFQGGKVNLIGNGVVLAPDLFMDEAKESGKERSSAEQSSPYIQEGSSDHAYSPYPRPCHRSC